MDVNTIDYSNFKLCSTRPVCIIKFEFFGCRNQFFLIKFDFCESFVVVVVVVIFVFSITDQPILAHCHEAAADKK